NQKSNSSQLYKMNFIPQTSQAILKPGMNVEVLIKIKENITHTLLSLPTETVFKEKDKTYVWVIKNNTVEKREVEIGGIAPNGDLIFLSGVTEDDIVVKAGVHALQENDSIHIIDEPSKTNVGGLL